jgi:hypothetical protein
LASSAPFLTIEINKLNGHLIKSKRKVSMRWIAVVIGVLVLLAGGVFFLQGINVLPGSFMTGQTSWAIIGFIMLVVGAAVCYFGLRRPATNS